MFDIVLVEPEIPPNAGNVIRLAANTGARLHLVEPLGFSMDDRQLKRAGLDYHELANVHTHKGWKPLREALAGRRMFAFTTRASRLYTEMRYAADDVFVFGAETRGLPQAILDEIPQRLRLPMRPGNRSLNLSNAVAVVVFEAWRQLGFPL
ncbi:MAG: tRNA (cytidine(34)-2'-O)-methyltransferase [Betaproteobacteria bacterium]|nr:MAG: tRNA (cytidine(34)-2'-O)-methyltransferase [Betaproteobacteria bacterium]